MGMLCLRRPLQKSDAPLYQTVRIDVRSPGSSRSSSPRKLPNALSPRKCLDVRGQRCRAKRSAGYPPQSDARQRGAGGLRILPPRSAFADRLSFCPPFLAYQMQSEWPRVSPSSGHFPAPTVAAECCRRLQISWRPSCARRGTAPSGVTTGAGITRCASAASAVARPPTSSQGQLGLNRRRRRSGLGNARMLSVLPCSQIS